MVGPRPGKNSHPNKACIRVQFRPKGRVSRTGNLDLVPAGSCIRFVESKFDQQRLPPAACDCDGFLRGPTGLRFTVVVTPGVSLTAVTCQTRTAMQANTGSKPRLRIKVTSLVKRNLPGIARIGLTINFRRARNSPSIPAPNAPARMLSTGSPVRTPASA